MTNHDEFNELEYLRQELTDCGADLYAATTENANLLARLQTCQELSGGVLPMSDDAIGIGRAFLKSLTSAIEDGPSGYSMRLSMEETKLLLDALRPFFGDGA